MTKYFLTILGLGLFVAAAQAEDQKPASTNAFKSDREKVGYALGVKYGTGWKRMDLDLDVEAISKGMKDSMSGGTVLLNEQEVNETLNKFSQELTAKRQEKQKQLAEKNKQEGDAFLAKNKTEPGVITLPSGLQYKIVTQGSGESPKATDTVTVNYRGTFIDGTEFDSSEKHGQAATFGVSGVIPGWTEALQLMKPGAKWKLFIPGSLAYGERGQPPNISPNMALLFDVELLSAKHSEPPAPAQPLTSDIIKVPSAEELKKGAKIETIKPEDIEKEKAKEREKEKK